MLDVCLNYYQLLSLIAMIMVRCLCLAGKPIIENSDSSVKRIILENSNKFFPYIPLF